MFGSLLKATVGVITSPIDVIADAVTLGGSLTDQDETYTGKKVEQIMDNLSKAADPDG